MTRSNASNRWGYVTTNENDDIRVYAMSLGRGIQVEVKRLGANYKPVPTLYKDSHEISRIGVDIVKFLNGLESEKEPWNGNLESEENAFGYY